MDLESAHPSPFAALLRRYRLARGLSQEELAERSTLSVQAVSALERGVRRAPYRATLDLLARALELAPAEREDLIASVRRGRARTAPHLPAPALARLASSSTPFIGREHEQTTVLRLMRSSRLLTLTGTGGVGKTRLAIEAAMRTGGEHPDGIHVVELAAISDPAITARAVAHTLGVHEQRGYSLLETLTEALGERTALLVLDNCEHLRTAVAEIAAVLLRACPRLTILATSREALGVIGETVWLVPSMTEAAAIRLFVDRAMTAHPAFQLMESNADAVATICRRLDGIPLAIELAAARARIFTAEQIAARLDDRLRLLAGGGDAAPPRQRTLRAALDWSYDLLSVPERHLLERLAVFAGGCEIEAAEAVCVGGAIDSDDFFDLLSSLVAKSLVWVEYRDSAARYHLLETVRQYASEHLARCGEEQATRERHGAWTLAMVRRAESELHGPDQAVWLDRLDSEHDNIRVALRWALDRDAIAFGLQLGAAMREFWRVRGFLSDAAEWLDRLLKRTDSTPADVRAAALHAAAVISGLLGSDARAQEYAEAALTLSHETGDERLVVTTLHYLGVLATKRADDAAAVALFEESLGRARAIGDPLLIRPPLYNLGMVELSHDENARARTRFREALDLAQGAGDVGGMASILTALGFVARHTRAGREAREHYTAALDLRRRLGDRAGIANTVRLLADLETSLGDLDSARAHAEEALAVAREIGHRWGVVSAYEVLTYVTRTAGDLLASLEYARALLRAALALADQKRIHGALWEYAAVAAAIGSERRAVCVYAASEVLRESIGFTVGREHVDAMERTIAEVRGRIGDGAYDAAWRAGVALSPESAIEFALTDDGALDAAQGWT